MCRLAAYIGPEIRLQEFLLEPSHGLVEQAWKPRELLYGSANADGYGIGWHDPQGRPAVYTNPLPIWSDVNLAHLGRSLSEPLWLAIVRSATAGFPVHQANTAPFYDEQLLYAHNGFIREFSTRLRPILCQYLAPEILAGIQGNTDSEHVFALLRHLVAGDPEFAIEEALGELFALLEDWVDELPALLNITVSDGERIYATRHAFNHTCPSLYYTTDDEMFPGGQVVASEPLTDGGFWQPVPEHHLLILDPEQPPQLLSL
ncbi:MAG: ergothioneine biosynthesis protein EgtC [Chromatiales bacterium 21-64-14]|nr:MAG: ergothioneine biosynthesis protein EgtC [Chromatiales bacterium 21-64-14]HQU16516.1 ergothioneine biosynthesis protein EgtC [Gammaproteobacteria bacterium]